MISLYFSNFLGKPIDGTDLNTNIRDICIIDPK